MLLVIANGERSSFGLFLRPMTLEFGWSREAFAFAIALQNLVWGLSQPFVGAIADRFGSGRVIAVCGVVYAVGLYLMASATTPIDLALTAGVLIGLALSGVGFPVILGVIGRSVPENRRSLFLGLGSAGGASGQMIMVPVTQGFLDHIGSVETLITLSAIMFLLVPMAAILTGKGAGVDAKPDAPRQTMKHAIAEAARHSGFWYLTAGFFVCGFHVTFIATHLPAFIADHGIDPSVGALALVIVGLANMVGSLSAGYLGGVFRTKYVLSLFYLLRGVVIAVFIAFPVTQTSVLVFAFGIGLFWLGTVPLTNIMVGKIFGLNYVGMLFGFVFFSHQIGSFLGAWYGGYTYDQTGNYDAVWWISIGLAIAAAVINWPIDDRAIDRSGGARLAEAP
jgi:MFS family permease